MEDHQTKEAILDPQEMMKKMMGMTGEGSSPMEMCKGMIQSVTKAAEMATYATPELRSLFEEWLGQIEVEIIELLEKGEPVSPEAVAQRFKLSKESAVFLISKLARAGKIRISAEQSR